MKEKGNGQKNDKENIATIIDSDLGIVYDESLVNLTCHINNWVIDSGILSHVTAHRDYFTMIMVMFGWEMKEHLRLSDIYQIFALI